MNRIIFPTICQCLFAAASKGEIKVAAGDTLKALQRYTSDRIWQWVDAPLQQEEIKRLTV
jgi:hypothetical protein